jgi:asparagine synthase (glutamine-hydrolysing)
MGAFLLIKKSNGVDVEEIEKRYHGSLDVFNKMGLHLNQKIVRDELVIYVFHKYNFAVENFIQFDNNQFIISTGTLIYNRKIGRDALKELFDDFSEDGGFLSNALGHYCSIISKKGKVYIFNDYTGLYHVFSNQDKSVISNSFLAVLKTLDKKSVSAQALYEYIINGACFGDATLLNEINLLDSKKVWQLSPNASAIPRPNYVKKLDRTSSFNEMVQDIAGDLTDYFSIIKANFGNSICSALSGGVHTRMMLGLMRSVGIKPNYLYVYGDENNVAGRDANIVQIVKSIAEGEGLSIEHLNRDKFPRLAEDEYSELLEKRYYLFDGLGHEIGLFDNGSDYCYRLSRTKKDKLQLNGAGGEMFRNYWKLPDKSYHIRSFFRVRYDRMDYSIFTDCFDYDSHFSALQDKVKISLGIDKNRIDRRQIELLQPEFDNKYWMGSNNSINNLLSYSLTPFADIPFQYRGCDIPLKYKNYFTFESALMKFIDPDLARYPTSHGIDLFYNRFKLNAKAKYLITLNTPLWLKAYIRKHFWYQRSELFRLHGNKSELPFFLTGKYLDRIFKTTDFQVSRYVHVDKITDPDVLSRVLTAELVITDRF